MTLIKTLAATLIVVVLLAALPTSAAQDAADVEGEVRDMLERYLAVYNRRFSDAASETEFKSDIVGFLRMPLVMFPPTGAPSVIASPDEAARNFAGFTSMLKSKGVIQLRWHDRQLQVLTPTKVLVNNLGHGVDEEGNLVYETVSVYLLFKSSAGWQIQTLSPYFVENRFEIEG
jgi:hypothetical protein